MGIVSMTGFGRAEGAAGGATWAWEARSVNGRGLDLRIRVPTGFDALEPAVRDAAQKRFKRGSVQVGLSIRRDALAGAVVLNTALVETLIEAGKPFVHTGRVGAPTWDGLLGVRGVLASAEEAGDPGELRAALEGDLTAGLATALDRLAAMRAQEGAALRALLAALLDQIETATDAARALAGTAPAALLERIRARLAALAPEVAIDPQRLAQEAVVAAARADVREELDRLTAHVSEARALIAGADPAGRRLEFLAQEFNREANTLCSKSSELALTRLGLDLKTAIDQLREQAANVE
jgi:uncharacterized protein (TIGR00255 family)